jgi:serine/threonine-protein kinase
VSPGLHPDARDPRREPPAPVKPDLTKLARESLVWESAAVGSAADPAHRDGGPSSLGRPPKRCPHCEGEYDAGLLFCPRDGAALRGPPVADDDLAGQVIADRYRVLRKLGQGGMGQVYLAEHTRMGRFCAIKVVTPALMADTDAIARFDREASNVSRISHPGVAAVYDFGEASDGTVYLAMEYIDGEPLTALLRRDQTLPIERALRITRQIADALRAAHELGIVHRDLKPDNIMIGRNRDGSDCVKVVDFGISKGLHSASQKLTITGLVVGTPAYMSPEQLAADPVDGRSDIYSLGLVLFHMVAGTLPFAGGHDGMLARLIAAPRTLAETKPDREWPQGLQAMLNRAMAPAPDDRYQTADAMVVDIDRLLGSATPATSLPAPQRSGHEGRRRRTLVAGGVLITAGSVVVMIALSSQDRGRGTTGDLTVSPGTVAESLAAPGAGGAEPTPTNPSMAGSEDNGHRPIPNSLPPDVTAKEAGAAQGARRTSGLGSEPAPGQRDERAATNPPVAPITAVPPGSRQAGSASVAAELDSLEAWTLPQKGTEESARRALARFPGLLPLLSNANDSVAAHYYAAGAHIALGDPVSACAVLRPIERRAPAHPYLAKAIAIYFADSALNCR